MRDHPPRHPVCAALLLMASLAGCTDHEALAARQAAEAARDKMAAELASTKTQLDKARGALKKATSDLEQARSKLAGADAKIRRLEQTPRFFFDVAVATMGSSSDDAGDEEAIKAFQVVVDRYPDDPLAETATKRIGILKDRIKDRAKKLETAQAAVRKLIETCRRNTKAAKDARNAALQFNQYNDIDMNAAMAGERRAAKLEEAAKQAKERAGELLKSGVPDPDEKLAKALESCDSSE